MRLCNDTITLFNATFDPENDYDVYVKTVISGVHWFSSIDTAVEASGLKAAKKCTVRIPTDADFSGKHFVDPVDYSHSVSNSSFTLKAGDFIIRGEVDTTAPVTPKTLKENFSDFFTILGVTDNRRVPNEPHWKVVGA